MRTVFLETVGLLALWDSSDQWHTRADAAMQRLMQSPCRFMTTTLVLLECGNAASRTSYRDDVCELRCELASHGNLIVPDDTDEAEAWDAYRRGEAGQAGIVDHVSFVVMRRLGLLDVFTNDRHFVAAGFNVVF
jgi:predicted nucleic acid-binding protein